MDLIMKLPAEATKTLGQILRILNVMVAITPVVICWIIGTGFLLGFLYYELHFLAVPSFLLFGALGLFKLVHLANDDRI
jgi:hypothetical protein